MKGSKKEGQSNKTEMRSPRPTDVVRRYFLSVCECVLRMAKYECSLNN